LEKQTAIRIDGLSKRYDDAPALDDVTLELNRGECLGLLGPNGAGKTTLIRCIVGRAIPDQGSVAVYGVRPGSDDARLALGWVPQELALYPRLTCRENLEIFGRYQGLSGPALETAIAWALDWSALTERNSEVVGNLSGGMKRRLNMAAGLVHRPRIALMDEPTIGVDTQSRNRIFEMIGRMHDEGVSIIYTTHYIEEAERLCDRIAILDHARIVASGTTQDLVQNAFGSSSQVIARFANASPSLEAWIQQRGGRCLDAVAQFTLGQVTEIGALLDAAAKAGYQPVDVTLRKPNLESVFLKLTGRELRD
jgi:ABC-2 type transport system ATP-binding protein